MKKTLLVVLALSVMVISFAAVAPAYAAPDAGKGPGNGSGNTGASSTSILSDYMPAAIAEALGLEISDVVARLDAGETCYTIATAEGYTAEEATVLFAEAQAKAVEAAAVDGLTILQTQSRMQSNANSGTQNRLNDGTCDGTGDCQFEATAGTRSYRGGALILRSSILPQ
jgi:hypothetical protein